VRMRGGGEAVSIGYYGRLGKQLKLGVDSCHLQARDGHGWLPCAQGLKCRGCGVLGIDM